MKKIALTIYAVLCVIMAVATFVENSYGTEFAYRHFYGSWWFYLLWAVALILSIPFLFDLCKHIWETSKKWYGKVFGKNVSNCFIALAIASSFVTVPANAKEPKCIKLEQAEEMKSLQVVFNNRICPFNTVARDFTQKITGKHKFKGLTAEQILISWSLHPEDWKDIKMIKVKKKAALEELGVTTDRAAFADFFDSSMQYRLTPGKYPDIEEKLSIIIMATRGELYEPLPKQMTPKPENKIKAEILYNSISWNLILFICCFCLAILTFVDKKWKYGNTINKCVTAVIWIALIVCLCLRWYVSEHLPMTNTFETMQIVALSTLTIATFSNKWRSYALIVSGAVLLVTHISSLDPVITPLMPALQSPWLASHVTTIMISYALYAILLFHPDRKILIWAEILLGTGILLGSIWAKDAWGTYWNWDPKETWALITLIVYMYPLHTATLPWFRNEKHQKWYLRVAFLTVLMTYFGCNYILTGMHSYANS
ncbi:MAG: cytochrome c biogenesis protein CcsA [Bacteroidaceae bacterium]|nr:cytochrome c biogenesis protein CcsA [Bacteroidaceae bacterium]